MRIFSTAWGSISKQRLWDLILKQQAVAQKQQVYIQKLEAQIEYFDYDAQDVNSLNLEHAQTATALIEHFLDAIENEDLDVLRENLEAGLSDLKDQVARLQEHAEH